ncbi:hypothetical protein ABL78_3965 [Leptomonas seymouri]|uniref:Methyltransferase domain-containing protein n=1 Tax=Leptomonas seymouri TaxID=5684 RepID=A0A0N1HYW2_LEPSE|nr:hypothetical protein ABL78_3965 [Leptomonas seymouri]|eukprot:KPI86974.1 hypothetical protein ABL78_3965 [Leptomonas seymouri]
MEPNADSQAPPPVASPPPSRGSGPRSSTAAADERPAKKPKTGAGPRGSQKPAARSPPPAPPPDAVPTSSALLTARLKKEMREIWAAERAAQPSAARLTATTTTASSSSSKVAAVVPPFKVGTLEMYRRFPQAYDLLMQHHNCSAVQAALLHDIIGRIDGTASWSPSEGVGEKQRPWIRVADFGCGTGRIETMVAQHRAVQAIYAYDNEVAMLKQCLLNTVRSAAQSTHYSSVSLCPVATTVAPSSAPLQPIELCADTNDKSGMARDMSKGAATSSAEAELQLCVRPVPFQAIRDGFLAATHHPRCSLMVCAWSLSYVMRMQWGEDHWHAAVDAVVQAMVDHLDTSRSAAALVVLETLGNGSTEPTRQNTYTQRLEDHFGFTRTWVRTDYEFATRADAERMVRFFFGERMLPKLTMDADGVRCRLMECTGIWTLWKARQQCSGDS